MGQERLAPGKKNSRHGTIVFVDESGFSEGAVIRRTWAPRGQTPIVRPKGRSWSNASAMGALAYSRRQTRVFMTLHYGSTYKEHVVAFLRHLARHIDGRVVLIWDRLAAHRSRLVREWIEAHPRFSIEYLPPYAPELNPVEGLWAWSKGTALANVCRDSLSPILKLARAAIRRARRRPDLLSGFLAKSGLPPF